MAKICFIEPNGPPMCIDPTVHLNPLPWQSGSGSTSSTTTPGTPGGTKPTSSRQIIQREDELKLPIYPQLFTDVAILAAIQDAIKNITDSKARKALEGGIESALGALNERTGKRATVSLED